MVEQQLNLGRALTFTLRAGHPIMLTREQVGDSSPLSCFPHANL